MNPTPLPNLQRADFGRDFLWGCATSSYQIEGSPLADGAGPSIWHRFVRTPGRVTGGDTGDIACDHYRRMRDDVALMKDLGLSAYRFSIAWGRVMPEGRGRINAAGLGFYERLVDELLRAGITPLATLYHWDLPAALDDRGGWLNPDIAHWFADYASVMYKALDDRVPWWCTINEPWVVADGGYVHGVLAPGHRSAHEAAIAAHQLLRAHAQAVRAYRAIGRQRIGLVVNIEPKHLPPDASDADRRAAQLADAYMNRQYLDPALLGRYPDEMPQVFGDAWPDWPVPTAWLRANMVTTADGAARSPDGLSAGISSDADRRVFGRLRGLADVVLAGAGTVRAEGYKPAKAKPTPSKPVAAAVPAKKAAPKAKADKKELREDKKAAREDRRRPALGPGERQAHAHVDAEVEHLVLRLGGVAADHVADVALGHLVVGEVDAGQLVAVQQLGETHAFGPVVHAHADEDVGPRRVRVAVVELGDVAAAQQIAELLEGAGLLGDGDGQHGFALLAHLGALGDEAQAVEVHVGAGGHRHQGLVLERMALGVLLGAGYCQRAGGLEDGAGVLEDVLDGGADGIVVHQDHLVHVGLAQAEGFLAHQLDRRAVGEEAHIGQFDALAGGQGLGHGVGVHGFHADHLDVRTHALDVGRHAGQQAAAADAAEHRVDGLGVLAQDLHADGALAGDHFHVVVGVNEGELFGLFQFLGVAVGVGIAFAGQHHLAAMALHGVDLDGRGGGGHHDHRAHVELLGRQGHALGVVAGGGADHPALEGRRAEARHLVVGAAQLEAEHRLHVLALEVNLVVNARRQVRSQVEGRLDRRVIDLGSEDLLEVVGVLRAHG